MVGDETRATPMMGGAIAVDNGIAIERAPDVELHSATRHFIVRM